MPRKLTGGSLRACQRPAMPFSVNVCLFGDRMWQPYVAKPAVPLWLCCRSSGGHLLFEIRGDLCRYSWAVYRGCSIGYGVSKADHIVAKDVDSCDVFEPGLLHAVSVVTGLLQQRSDLCAGHRAIRTACKAADQELDAFHTIGTFSRTADSVGH